MVLDADSKRIVYGAVQEDDILKENVTSNTSDASLYGGELNLVRYRANRRQEANESRHGCSIPSLTIALRRGLLDVRP